MRPMAVILLVIFLGLTVLTGYFYFNTQVLVRDITCVAADAADQEALFQELKRQVEAETFTGTPFSTKEMGNAADYQFYTYTAHLGNQTFIQAEVAEMQVTPMNGDVLQIADPDPIAIPGRGEGTVQATILTRKDMHNVRELMITYYLWGLPFSARVTYSR